MTRLIFQLGTNPWQRDGEVAPGSAILHEAHHRALNSLPDTKAFSMYPSKTQRFVKEDVRVFELDHDIPIFEMAAPGSNLGWHNLTDGEIAAYRQRLGNQVEAWINGIEADHGESMSLAIVHHAFLNPVVLADVNERRLAMGRPRIPVLCFAHGAALQMYTAAKADSRDSDEFPSRFLPLMEAEGVFEATGVRAVDWVAAVTSRQVRGFNDVFPGFPLERMVLTPNGYDQDAFFPAVHPTKAPAWRRDVLPTFITRPYPGSNVPPAPVPGDYEHYVVFNGKFAEWKRLDALLEAASIWERHAKRIATIIIGGGSDDEQKKYQDLAYDKHRLKHTYFLGPRDPEELAMLFTAADVACFPSRDEPFGLTFIEAMACGTPVIGANSGGPKDFVNDAIGLLVLESEDMSVLGARLEAAAMQAFFEDWKRTRGASAMNYALMHFSIRAQVERMLSQLVHDHQLV